MRDAIPPHRPGSVRILSWNVARAAGPRLDDVAALVRSVAPDLLLLQEAVGDCGRLPALLGGAVHFQPAFAIRGTGGSEGMALWSPKPLAAVSWRPIGGWPWPRVALFCRLGEMTVCNLHLSHLPPQRRRQLDGIARVLPPPVLIAGDFNRPGGCRLPGMLPVVPDGWSYALGPLRMRSDAALASPDIAIRAARYLESAASDHRPLLLDVAETA